MTETTRTFIDLRSDTVTKPTPAMWEAMANAQVGDDVYGEDPSVNQLEAMVAEMLGKEAAIFVASGTMGNLISVLGHCGRGDEMILGDTCHIFRAEQGGAAAFGGVHPLIVANQSDGTLDLDEVAANIRPDNEHYPTTRLLCLENTQNASGGRALTPAYMDQVAALTERYGLKLHIDGARLWNAAVALDVPLAKLVEHADSVSVCLSKGLGAPVGSLVVGDADFIKRVHRLRKAVGGGMRQAGVVAAAGIVAVSEMISRMVEDHQHARQLAEGLASIDGIALDPKSIETNLVFFELADQDLTPMDFAAALRTQGVLVNASPSRRMRMVTNYQISAEDIETTLDAVAAALSTKGVQTDAKVMVYT